MTTTVEKAHGDNGSGTSSKKKRRKFSPWGVVAWLVGLGFFFPVFWMVLTAFKQEGDAATSPPKLFFTPTLDQFKAVFDQGIGPAMLNSVFATGISTILVLLLGVPAAFALSLRPVRKTQDALFFFMSTKMLPDRRGDPAAVRDRVQHRSAGQHLGAGHPLHLDEPADRGVDDALVLPRGSRRAARGGQPGRREPVASVREVILPLVSPGIAATALICVIFAWNEFFFAVNLTAVNAQTMPVYLVGFIAGEGQYWAVLSAAATMAALPVILCGWFAQNKLVRGLSFGAIK